MSLQDTPRGSRLHIGIYGRRNSGKSSLLNALTGQQLAVTSDIAGTTTDPVYKSMEVHGIGPVVWIDTAGFDDTGELGEKRVAKTAEAAEKTDIALLLFTPQNGVGAPDGTGGPDAASGCDTEQECAWYRRLRARNTPVIPVLNKVDLLTEPARDALCAAIEAALGEEVVCVSATSGEGTRALLDRLIRALPPEYRAHPLLGGLVGAGDLVLLVMPQDPQAPEGRLILPQVQTVRELLDRHCLVMSCSTEEMPAALQALARAPKLIVTDSQVFRTVHAQKPAESLLTSFSILMAASKGDIAEFVRGAASIDRLGANSRVLIAEACTHAPLAEDIGREKIPRMLRARCGQSLAVDVVSGRDFPQDLSGYDLIVHCGACMFNRKYVMARIGQARAQGVPITNYGVAIAHLNGILQDVTLPD